MHKILFLPAVIAACTLAGCAGMPGMNGGTYQNSANTYSQSQTQGIQQVLLGTVLAVHHVTIQAASGASSLSTLGGAGLGGLAGSTAGNGKGKTVATVLGALAGAVGGHLAAGHLGKQPGLQITIVLDGSHKVIDVTQAADVKLSVGEKVQVIGSANGGTPVRVEPLN